MTSKDSNMSQISVIDFAKYQRIKDTKEKDSEHEYDMEKIGEEIKAAFETVGFCYIKNHGIDAEIIEGYFNVSRIFFAQPLMVKQKYSRDASNFGWVPLGTEQLVQNRPAGYRESFNYISQCDDEKGETETRDFFKSNERMVQECTHLARRILGALSVGLGLETDFMERAHSRIGLKDNYTCLKSLYYPPIPDDTLIKPNQIRIGEHSDFGTQTILFQDDNGGLEIEVPGQGFVPATPIPGTAVVHIGDLMQRWSADKLIAPRHRVIIPEVEIKRRIARQSSAFFVHPDDDAIIKCLDGSGKYEEISALDYVTMRLDEVYSKFQLGKNN